ncbi:MAG: tyrosine-type recombinase/integrase [Flavobacteriales bacterium]|nr:tyrosine-type recombinase/integrase [Flavobacteriales bacterium]
MAYNKFIRFLSVTGIHHLELSLPREQNKTHPRTVLTKSEIKALYSAIETYPDKRHLTTPYRLRDRAILAIFYSCGLRSNEGSNLDVSDILTDRRLIIVRKGKGNKERYVPITPGNLQDIENYITRGRSWFLVPREKQNHINNQALLINEKGSRLTSSGIYIRIKYLQEQSGVDKQIGIHTLRHSIATHLLQSGMEIEPISKFLGHSTLASTQIYTHLSAEVEDQGGYCQ